MRTQPEPTEAQILERLRLLRNEYNEAIRAAIRAGIRVKLEVTPTSGGSDLVVADISRVL